MKIQAVRSYQKNPGLVPVATPWKELAPPEKRSLDVEATIELLHHSRKEDPARFERCRCQILLGIVEHARVNHEPSLGVLVAAERMNENGVKMLRFIFANETFEVGEGCFE